VDVNQWIPIAEPGSDNPSSEIDWIIGRGSTAGVDSLLQRHLGDWLLDKDVERVCSRLDELAGTAL